MSRRTSPLNHPVTILFSVCLALSACASPRVPTNAPDVVATPVAAVPLESAPANSPPAPESKVLGAPGKPDPMPAPPAAETQIVALALDTDTPTPVPSMTDAEIAAAGENVGTYPEPSRKPRLFGFLRKRVPGDVTAPEAPESLETAADSTVSETSEPVARRGGLFGYRGNGDAPGPTPAAFASAPTGGPVAGLPFGQIVKVCGTAPRDLGTEVARSEGAGTYRLYDSDPSSIAIRPQFITGFDDNCARQFNAALALFGTSAVHEAMRYNPLNANPYSETDNAYEKVKRRLCGVRQGKACPDNKSERLARKAAFVSVYRGFGSSDDWLEMFLHDGEVVAYSARTN